MDKVAQQVLPLSFAQTQLGLRYSHRLGPLVRQSLHRMPECYDMLHAATVSVKDIAQARDVVAAGGGLTQDRASFAAIGEALERLSLRQHRHLSISNKKFECLETEIDPGLFLNDEL